MTIEYDKIQRQCALRSGQLIGTDAATLQTAYGTTAWASALDGAEVPTAAFKDTILAVEKELAQIIGLDPLQPYRNSLYGISSNLTDGATVPTTDANSKEFIGAFSGFVDGADSTKILTEQPVQVIEDLNESFFTNTDFYHYALVAGRVRHTRANAKAEGCIWDYSTQSVAYDAAGNSPLPQACENMWIAGVLAQLSQESGWFAQEAQIYAQIFHQGVALLKNRQLDTPTLPSISGANPIRE